jgi:arylsulfatase A-like enzyme
MNLFGREMCDEATNKDICRQGSRSVAFVLALSPSSVNAQDKKPNFVMIMTDDVGWGDLGSYGGGIMRGAPTPNLDRMAAEGMRFLSYYGQASCTAGRASFITGRIPIRIALVRAYAGRSQRTHVRNSDTWTVSAYQARR